MKQLKVGIEFSSIVSDAKWLESIKIRNFTSKRKENTEFIRELKELIDNYNKGKTGRGKTLVERKTNTQDHKRGFN